MMPRPRAISLRTSSGSIFSRRATYSISSVTIPFRAKCICVTLRPPFVPAAASRFSIHTSRMVIGSPFPPGCELLCEQSGQQIYERTLWHRVTAPATLGWPDTRLLEVRVRQWALCWMIRLQAVRDHAADRTSPLEEPYEFGSDKY